MPIFVSFNLMKSFRAWIWESVFNVFELEVEVERYKITTYLLYKLVLPPIGLAAAWMKGQRCRFCDNPDCTIKVQFALWSVVTLLRVWIRHCTMIISAWWPRTSDQFTLRSQMSTGSLEYRQLPSGWGRFVQNISAIVASSWVKNKVINLSMQSIKLEM